MDYTSLLLIFSVLLVPGIVGAFFPILPALPYMFGVALVFGLIDRFSHLTILEIIFLALIVAASFIIDYLAGPVAIKMAGGSRRAIQYAFIGSIIGLLVLPPFGSVVGLVIGVIVGEVLSGRSVKHTSRTAIAGFFGMIAAIGSRLVLALTFLILFILFALH